MFGFAAVPNYSNGSFRTPGGIVRFNPTSGALNTDIPFPSVQNLAMDMTENHLLAFTTVDNNPHWVDLTTLDPNTQVPPYYTVTLATAAGAPVSLSQPVSAFFSADNTKAYILSCGYECGGTGSASVTEIDTTSINAPTSLVAGTTYTGANVAATVLNQWPVMGARIGLIDLKANKLYLAGSSTTLTDAGGNNVQDGYFTVLDLTAGTTGAPIRIGNGVKRWIRNINGTFWVASLNCGVQSCVSMVNGTTASTLANANGDATGVAFMPYYGQVFTIEGGQLYIYNQQGQELISQYTTDIKGQGYDVMNIN
jgi:hypothetical protein